MTKKDYELIAGAIARELKGAERIPSKELRDAMVCQTRDIVYSLSEELRNENPKFDKVRFWEACGIVEA